MQKVSWIPAWLRGLFLQGLRALNVSCPVWCRGIGFIWLNIYKHRGYWFHGPSRDLVEWKEYTKHVRKGDFVLEIGAHVGFLTRRYSNLVGPAGFVLAVEPSGENFSFLKKNTENQSNIKIANVACGDVDGEVELFEDPFGGFCSSVNRAFYKEKMLGLRESLSDCNATETIIRADCKSIDSLVEEIRMQPDFIKIDVEGFELSVLKGASKVLTGARVVMVEVSCDVVEVHALLKKAGFMPFAGRMVGDANDERLPVGNIFFLKDAVGIKD